MADTGTCPVCKRDIRVRKDGLLREHSNRNGTHPGTSLPWSPRCDGAGGPYVRQQYGVRFGECLPVFAEASRAKAESMMAAKGRGVLMVIDYVPGQSGYSDWREVEENTDG